jgi:hypothetical protein
MYNYFIITCTFLIVLFPAGIVHSSSNLTQTLKLWLIPLEFNDNAYTEETQHKVLKEFGNDKGRVVCENLTDFFLKEQLYLDKDKEQGYPNWKIIANQQKIFNALKRFSQDNNVRIMVRFLGWNTLFESLESKLYSSDNDKPDIVQMGSTWVGFFREQQLLQPLNTYNIEYPHCTNAAFSLPFTTDIRILFYWKQFPDATDPHLKMNLTGDWNQIINTIKQSKKVNPHLPGLCFPIGFTYNLLHNFVPIVWSSGYPFLEKKWDSSYEVHLTENKHLKYHKMLAKNGAVFPNMTNIEAFDKFVKGNYLGIVSNIEYVQYWYNYWYKTVQPQMKNKFWDFAGIAVPPTPFKGGSHLALIKNKNSIPDELKYKLLSFIVNDTQMNHFYYNEGILLTQKGKKGIKAIFKNIPDSNTTTSIIETALKRGREYPSVNCWVAIESLAVKESMFRLWKAIAQDININFEANRVSNIINNKILLYNKYNQLIIKLKVLVPTISILIFLFFLYYTVRKQKQLLKEEQTHSRRQEELFSQQNKLYKQKIIAYNMIRGKTHSILGFQGARIYDFARLPSDDLKERLKQYGEVLSVNFNQHWSSIIKEVLKEIEGIHSELTLKEIIDISFKGAKIEFYVNWAEDPPLNITLNLGKNLNSYCLKQYSYVLIVILQEWLYNCLKNLPDTAHDEIKVMLVTTQQKKELHISTPPYTHESIDPIYLKKLIVESHSNQITSIKGGEGLFIIRDLLWSSFESYAQVASLYPGGGTLLILQIPCAPVDQ